MGTVSTFVACCYKHDICILISTIVTWNTLKCAISRAKFQQQKILGRDTALHTSPSCALATSLSPPFRKSWIHHWSKVNLQRAGHIVAASRIACYSCRNFGVFSGGNCWKTALECLTWYQSDPLQIRIWKKKRILESATPPIPKKWNSRAPQFGVILYLCLHPLTPNDQVRHGRLPDLQSGG